MLAVARWAVLALVAMPLVPVDGTMLEKVMYGRFLVMVAFVAWLFSGQRARPTPVLAALLAWILAAATATALSVSPWRSTWGDLHRGGGLFQWLCDASVFVIASAVFRSSSEWKTLARAAALVGGAVSSIALIEARTGAQPASTMGNPALLASSLLYLLGFAGITVMDRRSRVWTLIALACFFLDIAAIVKTGVRSAQLAMIAGGLLIGLSGALSRQASVRERRISIALLTAAASLPLVLVVAKQLGLVDLLPLAYRRLAELSVPRDASLQPRVIALGVSWEAFKDHPLVGWGPEMFRVAYNRHFNPEHLAYNQFWFDRPHNKIAEVAVTTGILGLITWLGVMATAAVVAVQAWRRRTDARWEIALLGAALAAWLIHLLALFDSPPDVTLFMLTLAWLAFRASEHLPEKPPARHRRLAWAALIGTLLVTAGVQAPAAAAWFHARSAARASDSLTAYVGMQRVVGKGGFAMLEGAALVADALLARNAAQDPSWDAVTSLTEEILAASLEREQHDPRRFILLGKLYHRHARLHPELGRKAQHWLQRAAELSPRRPEATWELGGLLIQQGDVDGGLAAFRSALELNPRNVRARWNLGVALMLVGRDADALGELEAASRAGFEWHHPVQPAEVERFARAYENLGSWQRAAEVYRRGLSRSPNNTRFRARLAMALAASGDHAQARAQARKAVAIDPALAGPLRAILDEDQPPAPP